MEIVKQNLRHILGNGVTLQNFDYDEGSGVSLDGFKFDGIDDYMTVEYQDQDKVDAMLQHGFTFEFYGSASGGNQYEYTSSGYTVKTSSAGGGFGWWSSDPAKSERFHFRFTTDNNRLSLDWSNNPNITDRPIIPPTSEGGLRLGPEGGYPYNGWNSYANPSISSADECYFSITLDPNSKQTQNEYETIQQTLYINGEEISSGWYYLDQWNNLKKNQDELKYFTIGSTTQNAHGIWWVGKMDFKSLRLYNRALNEDEVR